MPCRDDRDSCYSCSSCPDYRQEIKSLTARNDELADMLCYTLTKIEGMDRLDILSDQTRGWWEEHKLADKARLKAEAEKKRRAKAEKEKRKRKQELLDKMSPEDRRLLGL